MAVHVGRVEQEHATARHLGFACLTTLAKEKLSGEFIYSYLGVNWDPRYFWKYMYCSELYLS